MKNQFSFFVLLFLLVVTDAWLLAHPNWVGRIGIWFYKYHYLKTFPRALATVSLATLAMLGAGFLIRRCCSRSVAFLLLGGLVLAALAVLVQTLFQFSDGTYVHTGAGFKTGAILLPVILLTVAARHIWQHSQAAEKRRKTKTKATK